MSAFICTDLHFSVIARETLPVNVELERDTCRWFQTIRDANGNDVGRFALKPSSYKG